MVRYIPNRVKSVIHYRTLDDQCNYSGQYHHHLEEVRPDNCLHASLSLLKLRNSYVLFSVLRQYGIHNCLGFAWLYQINYSKGDFLTLMWSWSSVRPLEFKGRGPYGPNIKNILFWRNFTLEFESRVKYSKNNKNKNKTKKQKTKNKTHTHTRPPTHTNAEKKSHVRFQNSGHLTIWNFATSNFPPKMGKLFSRRNFSKKKKKIRTITWNRDRKNICAFALTRKN